MELKEPRTRELKEDSFKRLELGKVPKEWAEVTLFTAAGSRKDRFDDGDWVEAEFITDKGVRLIQTGNIGSGQFLEKADKKYVSEASFQLLGCKEIRPGDLLISRLAAPAGRACVLPDIGEKKMITSVDVTIVRPVETFAVSEYLNQLFLTREWFEAVALRCGGTTHSRIPRSELGKIVLPLPKPEEQRAIATALSDVDGLLAGLDALIAKKKALKQGAMQQLLTGKQRLPGFKGEWNHKPLEDYVAAVQYAIVDGPFGSQMKVSDFVESGIPVIEMEHLNDKHISDQLPRFITEQKFEQVKRSSVRPGDIVISKTGSLGYLGVVPQSMKRAVITSRLAKITLDPLKADTRFIFHYLLRLRDQGYWEQVSQGGTMQILGTTVIKAVPVPSLSLSEQTAIAEVLSDMDAELGALEARRAKTALLKQGMMQELLTGRTRLI